MKSIYSTKAPEGAFFICGQRFTIAYRLFLVYITAMITPVTDRYLGLVWKLALPFFICSGILKAMVFFDHFHISILSYLEFSELLGYFIEDIPMLLFVITVLLLPAFLQKKQLYRGIPQAIAAVGIWLVYADLVNDWNRLSMIFIIIAIIIALLILKTNPELAGLFFKGINMYFLLVSLVVFQCANEKLFAYVVEKRQIYQGSEFYFDNRDTIKANSSLLYVAKTKNYLFFYNPATQVPQIYTVAKLTKMVVLVKKFSFGTDIPQRPPIVP